MELYTLNDVIRYYHGSWILNPNDGQLYQVTDRAIPNNHIHLMSKKGNTSVDYSILDWSHMRCPPLGYRTDPSGRFVWYATKRPLRTTTKGLNNNTVRLQIPPSCAEYMESINYKYGARVDEASANEIHNPTFIPMEEAVKRLVEDPKATGFALNPSWAVTIGSLEGEEFQLHFKGLYVAHSPDGVAWKFLDKDAGELFELSSVR